MFINHQPIIADLLLTIFPLVPHGLLLVQLTQHIHILILFYQNFALIFIITENTLPYKLIHRKYGAYTTQNTQIHFKSDPFILIYINFLISDTNCLYSSLFNFRYLVSCMESFPVSLASTKCI